MKDEKFAPINNTDTVSAEDLLAQADALLSVEDTPAAPMAEPAQNTYAYPQTPNASDGVSPAQPSAPEGYELRYVQTAQGYQPVYMPISQAAYPPAYGQAYAQSPQAAYPQTTTSVNPKRSKASSQARPANALREKPRKKPWGKIIGACVLSAAIVALVVWGVVAGATALIRRMGEDRSNHSGYDDGGFGGSWNGMGGYDEGPSFIIDENGNIIGGGSLRIDASGNIMDEDGNIIGNVHDGGFSWNQEGNTVIISPFDPDSSGDDSDSYQSVDPENSLMFIRADGGLNVRDTPNGDRLTTVPNGYPVNVYAFQGDWAYIGYGDMSGWVDADYLSYEPVLQQKLYYVHADGGLNMRAEPTTASSRVENIPNGTQVYSLARFEEWVFTFYGDTYGWVHSDYLGASPPNVTQPQQGSQGSQGDPGSTAGYTMADVEAAIAEAQDYYRSRKGKSPNGGLRSDSLTDEQVEQLYWDAVGLVVGMEFFPAGQFENFGEMLELSDGYGFYYQVSDPDIQSMEDWADLFYSVLTDDLACDILCATPMFMLDGKMYISGGAMGDEGLITQYTIRVEDEPGGYKLIMDVVNIREDYYTGTQERMEWSLTAHCFKEDGVWVFDKADTPYR